RKAHPELSAVWLTVLLCRPRRPLCRSSLPGHALARIRRELCETAHTDNAQSPTQWKCQRATAPKFSGDARSQRIAFESPKQFRAVGACDGHGLVDDNELDGPVDHTPAR